MAKKKQLSIEQRARIDILAAEGFSQQSIAKKLGISKFGVFENSRGGLKLLACGVCPRVVLIKFNTKRFLLSSKKHFKQIRGKLMEMIFYAKS